ncbi:MAG: DUF2922 family protein [Selenomonadaceae bacterium]|nr:DUF2922 family protein [Selenomonadaceae bacterium]
MADKVTTNKTLKLVATFTDGDTRTLDLDNPKDGLTKEQIKAFETVAKNTQAIIGDKGGAEFHEFDTAKVVEKQTIQLDLR